MALPTSESFTNSDGTELNAHNSNFTSVIGTININTNAYHPAASNRNSYRWTADAFDGDHYSECTIAAVSNNSSWVGCSVRNQSAAATFYALNMGDANGTDTYLVEVTAGTQTALDTSTTGNWSVTDTLRISIEGSTITPTQNGSAISGIATTVSDSSITGGAAGVSGYGNDTANRADDWVADDVGGVAAVAPTSTIYGCLFGPMGGVV